MRNYFTVIFLAAFFELISLSASADGEACGLSKAVTDRLLQLDFVAFDQSGEGWRAYAKSGCHRAVGELLERYLAESSPPKKHLNLLHFHAGQMFAHAGNGERALIHFRQSFQMPRNSRIASWNDYVWATIGFLERDRSTVETMRNELRKQPPLSRAEMPGLPPEWEGKRPNLDRVEGFLRCWDKSYTETGQAPCRPRAE